jgi:hypothetical protein
MSMRQRCRVAPVLGRHHRGFAGDFPRNPHQTGLTLPIFPTLTSEGGSLRSSPGLVGLIDGQPVQSGGLAQADTEVRMEIAVEQCTVPSEVLNRFQRSQVGQKSETSNQILIWYTARIA